MSSTRRLLFLAPSLRSPSPAPARRSTIIFRAFSVSHPPRDGDGDGDRPPTRTPSLADIAPGNAPAFDARQKVFREQTVAQQRARAEEQRQHVRQQQQQQQPPQQPAPAPPPAEGDGVASTTTAAAAAGDAPASAEAGSAPSGPRQALSSLIYGTKEGRDMEREMERSFSQVLARGKYVHSIVFHRVKPAEVDAYVKLVGAWYPRVAGIEGNQLNLVGSWRTEVGDCDTFVHIWEYRRYQGYHASLHAIAQHPDAAGFERGLRKLLDHSHSSLMQEFSFWPTTAPRQLGGLFELRSYTLHPGNLLEWETHWRRGLQARREVMEGVGAWFVQIGDLNTVHHLWQFADLEERKRRRERSWSVDGWSETVHKTVPLIQSMQSRVLIAMPWSPVA
ncbi:MAG: hypothetical protein M1826_001657 [Phylliscum demangeonii]|nr:MAG: hypothetical protein M1826_001657 [Phylliscum demangeonii]